MVFSEFSFSFSETLLFETLLINFEAQYQSWKFMFYNAVLENFLCQWLNAANQIKTYC